jgi:hypothetical protein
MENEAARYEAATGEREGKPLAWNKLVSEGVK